MVSSPFAQEEMPVSAENRRFIRYDISLRATLLSRSCGAGPCIIRNFCGGGMYLAVADDCRPEALAQLRNLGPGDVLVVRFSVPTSRSSLGFEIRAAVVWAAAGKLGIAFSGDYPEAVTALVETAKSQGCERFPGPTIDPGRGSAAAPPPRPILQAIVRDCQPLALDTLTESCNRCFAKLDQDLFQATLGCKSNQEQTQFLDAMIAVRGERQRLGQDILARVSHDLERLAQGKPPLAGSVPGTGTAPGKASLSLVTKEDLEDFLALSNVVARLEIHLTAPLLRIERGLALLLSCPPEKIRNPLAPANLCHVFSNVFQGLRIISPQIQLAYQAWETALLERLGEMYAKIEERFMGQGIVPNVEAPVVRSPARAVRARERETEPGGMYPGGPESSEKRRAGRLSTEGSTSTVPPYGSNTEIAAGPAFNDIDSDTVGSDVDLGSPPHKLAALESLAAVLRRQTPGAPDPMTVDLTRAAPYRPATAFYTAPEIREALIHLHKTDGMAQRNPEAPAHSFTERLVGALAAQDGPPDRRLRPQDLRTIEIVSRLVPALAQGDRIGHARASPIERIAPHLYHTALSDPSFLSDPQHPTRRLLETLMRLQTGAPEDAWPDIESALTVLVEGNADDTLGRLSAVSDALQALQRIDATRQARHAQNLREFISGCEAQQAFLRSRHQLAKRESGATAPVRVSTPAPPYQPQGWAFWLDRARRLQIGDALQFSKGTKAGQRLELAWVGEGHSPLMFVDAEGKKAGSWTLQELAMLLRTGAASFADPAARSPVDQAFLSVLHSLFSDLCQQAVGGPACETTTSSSGVAHDAGESLPERESDEEVSEYPRLEPVPDWAACLEQALHGESLEFWVQPIESQTSRSVMGVRLVPRIRFAGQVLHLPEETEDKKLTARLQDLGRRVIRDTLGWLAAPGWGVEVLVIALSPIQLTDPVLIDYTIERLMESTVPPRKLCFELAEATVLAHFMEVLHVVGTLRELGCRILISGLGRSGATGEYLSRVSADFLAVDRRFIAGMVTRPRDLAVVKSSQEMARTLGRKTLAEGVESDEQGRIIGDLGIDYLVGPLGPPPHLQSEPR